MNKREGMIYTTFALLSSALLLFLVTLPTTSSIDMGTSESIRIGEVSFFMDSILDDMDRSLSMSTRRTLTASTNYIIENNQPLVDADKNISSALVNGSISGQELSSMENVSLNGWTRKVENIANQSGYSLETSLRDYSFTAEKFEVESSYTVFARLEDSVTLAAFNRTNKANATTSIDGIEDPMILLRSKGRYVSKYSKCGFKDPADKLHTGSFDSNDTVHGDAEIKPSDASSVPDPGEKILVADNIDNYADSDVESFKGAVAADNSSTASYSTAWVLETGGINNIEQNMSLTIHKDEVWRSNFREMFKDNCYITSSRGPGFLDRLENRMVSPDGEGLATMINVADLPTELREQESAVGYAYFNESAYGANHKIKGVTDEYSWFRIDDFHVDLWDLDDLTY